MENTATSKPRALVLGAAVSVIIISLLGAVASSGPSPSAHSEKSEASAPKNQLAVDRTIPVRDSVCASCRTVKVVRVVELRGNVIGSGAGAGGVGGALIGNDLGSGHGTTALTILGAAAAALT